MRMIWGLRPSEQGDLILIGRWYQMVGGLCRTPRSAAVLALTEKRQDKYITLARDSLLSLARKIIS